MCKSGCRYAVGGCNEREQGKCREYSEVCVAKCKGMGNESTCDVSVVVCGCSGCGVESAVCKGCGALGGVE